MNRHSDNSTIRFYDVNADEYIRSTVNIDTQSLYAPFLSRLPAGGRILDAGCGSGRDSKEFLDRGYQVVSIDASQKMVEATAGRTGRPAVRLAFQDVSYVEEFDGIWACASLLHVPLVELADVLCRFRRAIRPSGIVYASFKKGQGERTLDGRLFTDMNELEVTTLVAYVAGLEIVQIWNTGDLRAERSDQWLNLILRKA